MVGQILLWIAKLYWPPDPDMRSHAFRYHLAQSVGILGIWMSAWIVGLWLIGKLPFIPQVAWASDVKIVVAKVDTVRDENRHVMASLKAIQVLQLRTGMSQLFKDACLAKRSGNQADLDSANAQLVQLTDQYYDMAGRPFELPSCDTVLVEAHH